MTSHDTRAIPDSASLFMRILFVFRWCWFYVRKCLYWFDFFHLRIESNYISIHHFVVLKRSAHRRRNPQIQIDCITATWPLDSLPWWFCCLQQLANYSPKMKLIHNKVSKFTIRFAYCSESCKLCLLPPTRIPITVSHVKNSQPASMTEKNRQQLVEFIDDHLAFLRLWTSLNIFGVAERM